MQKELIELIKNGSFSSGIFDSTNRWFIPTDWEVSWETFTDIFYGTLKIESAGLVYDADDALLLNYAASSDDWEYDVAYKSIFAPGIYQTIDLTEQDLSNVESFVFSMNARFDFVNNEDTTENIVDIYLYESEYNGNEHYFDDNFESYKIRQYFEVSNDWQTFSFNISPSMLSNRIYKIYITPHVNITGVNNENIIENTGVIVDDVSLLMTAYKEEVEEGGEDGDLDTGFIENGTFKNWKNGMPSNWVKLGDVSSYDFDVYKTNDYDKPNSLIFDGDYGSPLSDYSQVMPGLYQLIDLREYEYGADVTFRYSIQSDNINHSFSSNSTYLMGFYIYEASYDRSTGEYTPVGGLLDYVYKNPTYYTDQHVWHDHECSVTLKPGYYYVGFTSAMVDPNDTGEYDSSSLHVVIDDVIGQATARPLNTILGEYIDNGSFENNNTEYWDYDSTALTTFVSQPYVPPMLSVFDLGSYSCNIAFKSNISEADMIAQHLGLKQMLMSYTNYKAIFSFWHYTNSSTPLSFKVCIYKTKYKFHYDTYEILEPAIFEDTVTTSTFGWNNYVNTVNLEYNTCYTVVIYPARNADANLRGVYLDKISFIAIPNRTTSHSGTPENPLTTAEDGYFACDVNSENSFIPLFYPYRSTLKVSEYFIKIGSKYYCTTASKNEKGFFICYSNQMVDSPGGLQGLRYFFEDGSMAVSTTFEYQGTIYVASIDGSLREYEVDITYINAPSGDSITINTDSTKTLNLVFKTQSIDITLDVEISNTTIATITGITGGTNNNQVQILGKTMGRTTLRAYFTNKDGTVVERIVKIYVKDELPEEYKDAKIHIAYETNAMLHNSSMAVDYYILPEYLSDLSINWSSSEESVATVDMNGQILSKSTGSCVITAANAYSGESVSFTLYVVYDFELPTGMIVSEDTMSLAIGQTRRITTKLVDATNSPADIPQDVEWTSDDANIATVNKYGYITGVNRGSTYIRCSSVHSDISKSIPVTVTGAKIDPQDIELDCCEIGFNPPYDNRIVKIRHRFVPSDANTSDVVWSSSNESCVRVTQGGYVYVPPGFAMDYPVYITCTSTSRPEIFKRCRVDFGTYEDPVIITAFDTTLNTCVGRTLRIDYDYFDNDEYENIINDGKRVSISPITVNTVSLESDSYGKYINFVAYQAGTFEVRLTIDYGNQGETFSKVFTVNVYDKDNPPILKSNLTTLYALQNDSCILRCGLEDEIDNTRDIDFYVDFNDGKGYEPVGAYFEPDSSYRYQYFFISGYKLEPNTTYQVNIKAVDTQGFETITNATSLTIPGVSEQLNDYKVQLDNAKTDYDRAINSILDILSWLVSPNESAMPDSYKAEFFIAYRIFCFNYENTRDMLDQSIKYINSQISVAQIEMSTLSEALSSDGVSVAAYSEGDYTNSNYKNVTDMDYYQNECIKQLVARVLELEARLNELTNNNN